MAYSDRDYFDQLKALLPTGAAWGDPVQGEGPLDEALWGTAPGLGRCDIRAQELHNETDPRSTVELIGDWERVAGIPAVCTARCAPEEGEFTLWQRQNRVQNRLLSRGGQSKDYFIAQAAALGRTVTIEEFPPFAAGSPAGSRVFVGDGEHQDNGLWVSNHWSTAWVVHWTVGTLDWFTAGEACGSSLHDMGFTAESGMAFEPFYAGSAQAGDLLVRWQDCALECTLRRIRPAHTTVFFQYFPQVS